MSLLCHESLFIFCHTRDYSSARDCLTLGCLNLRLSDPQVFEAVMVWTTHDIKTRQESVSQLMEHVRLPLLPQEFLVQRVEEESLIKHNSRCKDYLIEAMKFHLLKPDQKHSYKTPRTKARTPVGLPKVSTIIPLVVSEANSLLFAQVLLMKSGLCTSDSARCYVQLMLK